MDRDKVIKALEVCSHDLMGYYCEECPYEPGIEQTCREILMTDALELLKEQQQRIEQLEIDRDILVKDINKNNCNTCKRECEHRPIPGDVVRANCFLWEGR